MFWVGVEPRCVWTGFCDTSLEAVEASGAISTGWYSGCIKNATLQLSAKGHPVNSVGNDPLTYFRRRESFQSFNGTQAESRLLDKNRTSLWY